MNTPLVSICCITYNHAPFIRQCLEGFLMQQPPTIAHHRPQSPTIANNRQANWLEILIHDDCSTDGTTEIVKEYAAKYPDKIFPLFETESLYKKVGLAGIDIPNYERAKGKYIAYCEGDDYWTDPLKLQKQVDWMEAHEEYSVCFHDFRNYLVDQNVYTKTGTSQILADQFNPDGVDISAEMYFKDWYTQPMTMLIRRSVFDIAWRNHYKYYRDQHEIYHLLKIGKCRLLNFDGGVRSIHKGGAASMIKDDKQREISENVSRELYELHKDTPTKEYYKRTLEWVLSYLKPFSLKRILYSIRVFRLDYDVIKMIKNINRRQIN